MRILIIQENGRHAQNRSYRECHSLVWSFRELGHDARIWGLGHSGFDTAPEFNQYDLILNLENYDQTGWLPELRNFGKPVKMLWAVDEHVQPPDYYRNIFERDHCDYWLHSTRDYVKDSSYDVWMPNAVDSLLVRPLAVRKCAQIGFCGHVHNRGEWMHVLRENFNFKADVGVIGRAMVEAINSYEISFNRNIANDINARNFEVIACGVPLLTGFNSQYEALGFESESNCLFFESKEELIDKTKWLLRNDQIRSSIGCAGLALSRAHTYTERAKAMLNLASTGKMTVRKSVAASPKVSVSICIITNAGLPEHSARKEYLRRLIASIELAGFPVEREIILAGAVPPGLGKVYVVQDEESAREGRVCVLRNSALSLATGEYVIHCDDDIMFTEGYWNAVQSALKEMNPDILCTRLLNPNGSRYWDWAAIFPGKGQTLLPYHIHDGIVYATGGHAIYRRDIFEKVHWNEALRHGSNEEFDFALQAHRAGLRVEFTPSATVFLQYYHCDAQAAISGLQPEKVDSHCMEFDQIVARIASTETLGVARNRFSHKLTIGLSSHTPKISILVGCYRYLQRFRLFAESIMSQEYPKHCIEVVIANPHSPDGLSSYIKLLQDGNPQGPHFKEVLVDEGHYRNRGFMIQRAFEASSGDQIIGMDCDLILPSNFLARVSMEISKSPDRIIGVYRSFLSPETTAKLLIGSLHPLRDKELLETEDQEEIQGYRGVLGYCQAVSRSIWESVGYPEEFDNIAISDVKFNERLESRGVSPLFLKDLKAFHLHHRRDWNGTRSDFF